MLTHEVRSGAFRGFFNPFKCRNVLSIVDFIQITHHNEISFDKEQWEEDSQIGQFSSSNKRLILGHRKSVIRL